MISSPKNYFFGRFQHFLEGESGEKIGNFPFLIFPKKKSRNFKKWKISNFVTLIKTSEIEELDDSGPNLKF